MRILLSLLLLPVLTSNAIDITDKHPRLLITETKLEELKKESEREISKITCKTTLLTRAKKLCEPYNKANTRDNIEAIQILGIAARLEPQKQEYKTATWERVNAWLTQSDWTEDPCEHGEIAYGIALAYDWFHSQWTIEEKTQMENAIIEKAFQIKTKVLTATQRQILHTGLGMAAIAIADAQPIEAKQALNTALSNIQFTLNEYDGGGWNEGLQSWHWATSFLCSFIESLENASGTDAGIKTHPGFQNALEYPLYLITPTGKTISYADNPEIVSLLPETCWLQKNLKAFQPFPAWIKKNRSLQSPLEFLWDNNTLPPGDPLPTSKHFKSKQEIVSLRNDWNINNSGCILIKGGLNNSNHWQHDAGHFIYENQGERWFCGTGPEKWRGKETYRRKDYYRIRAEGHNTLTINPSSEESQSSTAKCEFIEFNATAQYAILNLTPAYDKHVDTLTRGIQLLPNGGMRIQDEIQTKNPGEIWWFAHTNSKTVYKISKENPDRVVLEQNGKRLYGKILSPANAKFQEMPALELPTSPNPPHKTSNHIYKKLGVNLTQETKTTLTIEFLPEEKENAKVEKLENWKHQTP
jgi:hypothetical protein